MESIFKSLVCKLFDLFVTFQINRVALLYSVVDKSYFSSSGLCK